MGGGLGKSSVAEVFAIQAQKPKFDLQNPCFKKRIQTNNKYFDNIPFVLATGRQRLVDSLGSLASQPNLLGVL